MILKSDYEFISKYSINEKDYYSHNWMILFGFPKGQEKIEDKIRLIGNTYHIGCYYCHNKINYGDKYILRKEWIESYSSRRIEVTVCCSMNCMVAHEI